METNYQKGRRAEWAECKKLKEEEGYDIAQRTAGSHSPIDIIALRKKDFKILLVQKKTSISEAAKNKILEENEWMNLIWDVEFEVR